MPVPASACVEPDANPRLSACTGSRSPSFAGSRRHGTRPWPGQSVGRGLQHLALGLDQTGRRRVVDDAALQPARAAASRQPSRSSKARATSSGVNAKKRAATASAPASA